MICPQCGNELHEQARFCMFCGRPVERTGAHSPQSGVQVNQPASEDKLEDFFANTKVEDGIVRPASTHELRSDKAYVTRQLEALSEEPQTTRTATAAPQRKRTYTEPESLLDDDDDEKTNGFSRALPYILAGAAVLLVGLIIFLVFLLLGNVPASSKDGKNDTASQEVSSEASQDESESAKVEEIELSCGVKIAADARIVDLSSYPVDSLDGIENVTGIKKLIVTQGSLTDLTPLKNLTSLEVLTICNVPVTDISCLSGLTNLVALDISDTQVSAEQTAELKAKLPDLEIVGYMTHSYRIVESACSWEEARAAAEAAGGYLATLTTRDEYITVTNLLEESDLVYAWLGGYSENGSFCWITGETFDYTQWFEDEPSGKDTDGTVENKLCIWRIDGEWTENDQRNALDDVLDNKDLLGYVVEFSSVAGQPMN